MAMPQQAAAITVSRVSQPVSGEGGNTSTPSPCQVRGRAWCLTVNNYTDSTLSQLSRLSSKSTDWIIGKEIGEEKKTPHLQCYFRFKNQVRFTTLKNAVPNGHWQKAKGSVQQNYDYCSKDGDFTTNITKKWTIQEMKELVRAEYNNVKWRPWQQDVIDLLAQPADSRTIYWVYEPSGNAGKSFLAKYLLLDSSCILASGKGADILHGVAKAVEAGRLPKVILLDVPRVCGDFISYQAIELLKNGCAFSGKYESCQLLFPHPQVLVFSNAPPIREKLSLDRWMIYVIKDNVLYEKVL